MINILTYNNFYYYNYPFYFSGKSGDHNFVYNEDLTQSETKADVKLSWKREYYDEIIATLNLAWPLVSFI